MGATFTIELPASVSEGPALTPAKFPRELDIDVLPPSARNHSSGNGIAVDLAGVRVLLIDDEPDTLQVIARLFLCAGASVEAASSVDEALCKIARQRPEVLVSDIAMPQKDGYALIRELRAGPNADIPVLALTAYAREEDRARALAAGFQDHLAKPVDPAKILAAVRNLAKNNHRPGIAPLQTIPTAAQS
jgi:CheY-like chemotaxis protein